MAESENSFLLLAIGTSTETPNSPALQDSYGNRSTAYRSRHHSSHSPNQGISNHNQYICRCHQDTSPFHSIPAEKVAVPALLHSCASSSLIPTLRDPTDCLLLLGPTQRPNQMCPCILMPSLFLSTRNYVPKSTQSIVPRIRQEGSNTVLL